MQNRLCHKSMSAQLNVFDKSIQSFLAKIMAVNFSYTEECSKKYNQCRRAPFVWPYNEGVNFYYRLLYFHNQKMSVANSILTIISPLKTVYYFYGKKDSPDGPLTP